MTRHALALVLFAAALAACAKPSSPQPALARADAPRGCALGVPGATVVAEDTPDGIALSFMSSDRTQDLRDRVRDAAAQHGPQKHLGRGHGGRHGRGSDQGLQLIQAPPATSVAEDIESGARIRFVAVDPAERELLVEKLRERARALSALTCT